MGRTDCLAARFAERMSFPVARIRFARPTDRLDWASHGGLTFEDPDGWRVVLYPESR